MLRERCSRIPWLYVTTQVHDSSPPAAAAHLFAADIAATGGEES